jgi:hypothetical protein
MHLSPATKDNAGPEEADGMGEDYEKMGSSRRKRNDRAEDSL